MRSTECPSSSHSVCEFLWRSAPGGRCSDDAAAAVTMYIQLSRQARDPVRTRIISGCPLSPNIGFPLCVFAEAIHHTLHIDSARRRRHRGVLPRALSRSPRRLTSAFPAPRILRVKKSD